MFVKVKNLATGQEQVITKKAYELTLAKKRYQFISNAEPGSDIFNPSAQTEQIQSVQTEAQQVEVSSPNLTTTASQEPEKERGAEAVVNEKPAPKKRGPKPKNQNQISSPTVSAEI